MLRPGQSEKRETCGRAATCYPRVFPRSLSIPFAFPQDMRFSPHPRSNSLTRLKRADIPFTRGDSFGTFLAAKGERFGLRNKAFAPCSNVAEHLRGFLYRNVHRTCEAEPEKQGTDLRRPPSLEPSMATCAPNVRTSQPTRASPTDAGSLRASFETVNIRSSSVSKLWTFQALLQRVACDDC